ncbi:MAG: CHASE2 domain-containing protein, partial [Campylobacteraceae bacterium]|nr:CHASE2 domain-containing protein [Campylobacteraceae bacterium]
INNISNAKPANIGIDILFPEKDKTSLNQIKKFFNNYLGSKLKISGVNKMLFDNDKIFANELKKAQVTMPVYLTHDENPQCFIPKNNVYDLGNISTEYSSLYILCNLDIFQKSSNNIGFINAREDSDGILRRLAMFIRYKNYFIPSFGLANLMSLDRINVQKSKVNILDHTFNIDENSNVLLNFYNKKWHQTISAVDILSGKFDKNRLIGKFVLIGTSAVGLHDHYITSTGKSIAGIFAHATLIDNILHDTTIYQPETVKYINLLISFLLSIVILYMVYRRLYMRTLLLFLGAIVLYLLFGVYFLYQNIYISLGYFLFPYFVFFFLINLIFIIFYYKERKFFLEELTQAHSSTLDSMSLVVETRDAETGAHILRTKEYMKCLVHYLYMHNLYRNQITKNYKELVYRAACLHDIGKVGIPDHILKKPGKLSFNEYETMKQHSTIGKDIMDNAIKNNKNNQFLKIARNIAYCHHEKWDGSGYPCGIKKEEIPLEARMMALVDVYDALISKRYYKESYSFKESEDIIIQGSGKHFDPILVGVFIELKEEFKEIALEIR